jgi:3'-5' exonuclease
MPYHRVCFIVGLCTKLSSSYCLFRPITGNPTILGIRRLPLASSVASLLVGNNRRTFAPPWIFPCKTPVRMSSKCAGTGDDDDDGTWDEKTTPVLSAVAADSTATSTEQRLQNLLGLVDLPKDIQDNWKPETMMACYHNFLAERGIQYHSSTKAEKDDNRKLALAAVVVSNEFRQIEASTKKLAGRKALVEATWKLLGASSCSVSPLVATLLVALTLALDGDSEATSGNRAITSAMVAVLTKDYKVEHSAIAHGLFAAIFREVTWSKMEDDNLCPLVDYSDWHIIAGLAKAMQVTCLQDDNMARNVATILNHSGGIGTVEADPTKGPSEQMSNSSAAAYLSMAAQLQPWQILEPKVLVNAAISNSLWHAAERICVSAVSNAKNEFASEAVEALLEGSIQAKLYRQADGFATTFFQAGGSRRFLEARFLHACGTIGKVIRKGAFPVIDKQVQRVDNAAQTMIDQPLVNEDTTFSPLTAGEDIRSFTLQQLEEMGNVDAAHRLATVWGLDYVLDEEALLASQRRRREKYLQWENVLLGSPPDVISTPETLIVAVQELQVDMAVDSSGSNIAGFDAEWNEDDSGVDLFQLASLNKVILVDIPALSSTPEGLDALQNTIGRLFASSSFTKVGFACRQDISKLRTTRTGYHKETDEKHWFSTSANVVDLQLLVANSDRNLSRLGLSRVCERYLGKPLDKSEQCSYWNARPLSLRQRTYAALDAWTVRAIYDKLDNK